MTFLHAETGAVTVDWVVLTGALVGLGLAVMAVVSGGVEDLSGDIDTELKRNDIIKTAFETEAPPYAYECQFNCSRYNLTYGLPGMGRDEAQMEGILLAAIDPGNITAAADVDWSTVSGYKFDEFAAAYNAIEDQDGWTIPNGYDSLEAYETAYLDYLASQ